MNRLIFKLTRDVKMPCRAHDGDAGIDVFIPFDMPWESRQIYPGCCLFIPAGFEVRGLEKNQCLVMSNRSSLGILGMLVGASVIDSSYTGELHINLWNVSKEIVTVKRDQKIAQMLPIQLFQVETQIEKFYERENKGFGSSN